MISVKNADKKKFDFWTKSMDESIKECIFWFLLKLQFFTPQMILFYLKYPKMIFLT